MFSLRSGNLPTNGTPIMLNLLRSSHGRIRSLCTLYVVASNNRRREVHLQWRCRCYFSLPFSFAMYRLPKPVINPSLLFFSSKRCVSFLSLDHFVWHRYLTRDMTWGNPDCAFQTNMYWYLTFYRFFFGFIALCVERLCFNYAFDFLCRQWLCSGCQCIH